MSERDRHKSTHYSGKKPYLTHNYRTMMLKKTQEEYYFHELHKDPMSELLKPYNRHPELPGFTWEYMAPEGWGWPPFGAGGGFGSTGPPYDDDDIPPDKDCDSCTIVGPESIECEDSWLGQIIPSECAGFITFAIGLDDQEELETAVNDQGAIAVAVPSGTQNASFLVCSSGGIHGVTCCLEVTIDCCCESFTLTGAGTVNPSATWEGTIDPACPDADVEVTSNSGCTLAAFLNEAGDTVSVTPGADDCGSFTVTVSQDDCELSESVNVKINDTGQGGDYTLLADNCQPASACKQCRSTGAVPITCYEDIYFYSGQRWCCRTDAPGLPGDCFTDSGCDTGQSDCPTQECSIPCWAGTWYCSAVTCTCQNRAYVWYNQWEWVCSC